MAAATVVGNKCVVLASADAGLRQRLRESLTGMRWQVREAAGGAETMAQLEELRPEALVLDHWLPDLEAGELAGQIAAMYPGLELLRMDGEAAGSGARSPRRHELLHALREAMEGSGTVGMEVAKTDTAAWRLAPVVVPSARRGLFEGVGELEVVNPMSQSRDMGQPVVYGIEGMVGGSAGMVELGRLIRLVAPRSATVLIEGETGTGKEVVAKALHRLSARSQKPFVVLNCAAIPESLLEAELFGHTRGAFTGAVTSRTGRIEAAHGGTLFLDEIGEMPLGLQAKMLRFLECGELQRVGENEVVRVDVRVIAATHQELERRSAEGTFRLDLYHRLAVFPLEVPALRERVEDIAMLAEFFLAEMGKESPRKRLSAEALEVLEQQSWPGNVRELAHVLERATILAGDRAEIGAEEVRVRRRDKR